MADDFLSVSTLPVAPTPNDLYAFFNIPPDPEASLDDNIARKRRHWHALAASSPAGRKKAKAVKKLIQDAADALKRGTAMPDQPTETAQPVEPPKPIKTIDDVWAEIEDLLFGRQVQAALETAYQARNAWGADPKAHELFAWTIAGIAQTHQIPESMVADARSSVKTALAANVQNADAWGTAVRLELATGTLDAAAETLDHAETALDSLTARLLASRAAVMLRSGKITEGLADAVNAVQADPADVAARAEITNVVLTEAVQPLLPIESVKELHRYERAVDVAAWCAQGAPEAEDRVRCHRLWATRASQRVFNGSWTLRSMIALCTLFVGLPVYNRFKSEPSWQVLMSGPAAGNTMWRFVASPQFVQDAHRHNTQMRWPVAA